MSHPFGDQVSQLVHRKHGLSLSKLARGIDQPHSVISLMCQGQRLTGPQARERVVAIIRWLQEHQALTTLEEANGLLRAAGLADLNPARPEEARLLRLLAALPSAPASAVPPDPAPRRPVPTPITSFVGRQRELAEVQRLLDQPGTRLLSLTGPGGCGKTRLAVQLARAREQDDPNGVAWVDLAPLADPVLVPQVVVAALGLRLQADQRPTGLLVGALRPRRLLLVLDNCEHLIEACASLGETLLLACPALTLLTTSRTALGLTGEVVWPVPSLSLPDPQTPAEVLARTAAQYEAVQLFVERAAARRPGFALSRQNAASITRLCQQLDGLPLALELAAARVQVLSLAQLALRLRESLSVLTQGSRTAPPRQQTLRATLEWSYTLLSEPERRLLRRLAVFQGGCTLAAAETVCAGEGLLVTDVLPLLSRLVDQSLVQVEPQEDVGEARYRLLELLRQYALERLLEAGERERVGDQHLRCYLVLAEQAEVGMETRAQGAWLQRLAAEAENLRAALAWARDQQRAEAGVRLARALGHFWVWKGQWHEGRAWLQEMRGLGRDLPVALQASVVLAEGFLAENQDDLPAAVHLAEESLALWRRCGDVDGRLRAQVRLGKALLEQGAFVQARPLLEEGLAVYRARQDTWNTARMLTLVGLLEVFAQGDAAQARLLLEKSAAVQRQNEDTQGLSWTLQTLGLLLAQQGETAQAVRVLTESLALHRSLRNGPGLAFTGIVLGWLALAEGETAQAAAQFEESLRPAREEGLRLSGETRLLVLAGLAVVASRQENWLRAAQLLGCTEAGGVPGGVVLRWPPFAPPWEQAVARTRAELSEPDFTAAWAAGRAWSVEQASIVALYGGEGRVQT